MVHAGGHDRRPGPSLLVVPAAMPVNSLQDLVALAKRKPGELNAARPGPGSFQHLATELFRLQAGIDIVIVQYKGGGPALTDTIAGQVQMNVGSVIQNLPHVRSGKLKALGVGGTKRIAALPDVPTFAEAGLPGAEATNWWGIVAPAARRRRWSSACSRTSRRSWIRPTRASASSSRAPRRCAWARRSSRQFMNAETAKWTRVVKEAGIKAE